MLVLQHGFREAGEDFNTVAAIVLMKNDSYLQYKNSKSDRELLCKRKVLTWLRLSRTNKPLSSDRR